MLHSHENTLNIKRNITFSEWHSFKSKSSKCNESYLDSDKGVLLLEMHIKKDFLVSKRRKCYAKFCRWSFFLNHRNVSLPGAWWMPWTKATIALHNLPLKCNIWLAIERSFSSNQIEWRKYQHDPLQSDVMQPQSTDQISSTQNYMCIPAHLHKIQHL